ncbi:MAG: hypothetical protein V4749_01365 [Pseudomonadota bacterium]
MTSTLTIGLEDGKQPKNIERSARIQHFIDILLLYFYINAVIIAMLVCRVFI